MKDEIIERKRNKTESKTGIKQSRFSIAGSILRCGEAAINDPEIKQPDGEIIKAQEQEIQKMKNKLSQLEK